MLYWTVGVSRRRWRLRFGNITEMITNIRLQNLKALKDTGNLEIRPLNFLIGPNSSGKSALLQALLMIKQTVEDTRDQTNPLRINGPWVELGSYRDMVQDHDYFQPTEQGTHVRELALNDLGQFESEGLPEDFLAQGYEESVRHMKAVAAHVRGQSSAG